MEGSGAKVSAYIERPMVYRMEMTDASKSRTRCVAEVNHEERGCSSTILARVGDTILAKS